MDDFKSQPVSDPILDKETTERIFPQAAQVPASGISQFYRANKWYVWAIVFALAVIGILAFFAFHKSPISPTKEANVVLSLDLPETLSNSGDFIFRVMVENKDPSKLVSMNLEIVYPDGVKYISSSPSASNDSGTQFSIPDLVSGQNAVVTIKASMQGGINDTKEIGASLRYRYDNFNSNFEKKASASTRLTESGINVEIDGPAQAITTQPAIYQIKYTNNSDSNIQNARLQVTYPNNFTFAQSDPQPDLGKNIWNVSQLGAGQSGNIKITGNFSSANSGESKTLTAQFLVLDSSGNYFVQGQADFTSQISGLPLFVTQNLEQDTTGVASPGATLNYRLHYQNNAQTPARGVNIIATLDSKALDTSSIKADNAQVSGSTITWNASNMPELETVNSNGGGDLRFTVNIKNPATRDTSKNLTVNSTVKIKSDEYDSFLPGNTISIKVASPASIVGSLAFVSGSLPPKVGQDTVYKVSLTLRNSTNDLSNYQAVAYVPLDPSSFDSTSITGKESSSVTFDKATGKITWNAGTVPAHTGDFNPPRVLQFNLRLHPTQVQAGSQVTLLRNISVSAKDTFTAQNIHLTAEDLTTRDLPNNGYTNNGTVVN